MEDIKEQDSEQDQPVTKNQNQTVEVKRNPPMAVVDTQALQRKISEAQTQKYSLQT